MQPSIPKRLCSSHPQIPPEPRTLRFCDIIAQQQVIAAIEPDTTESATTGSPTKTDPTEFLLINQRLS
jgi:hypothetical protein